MDQRSLWRIESPPPPPEYPHYPPPPYYPPSSPPVPPPPYYPPSPPPVSPPPYYPPYVTPPPPPPYYPPPPSRNVVVIAVVVPIAGLVFLGLLAGFLLFARRRRREEAAVEEVEVSEHVRVQEEVVAGPSGQLVKVLDIQDDVDVKEHIVRHERDEV